MIQTSQNTRGKQARKADSSSDSAPEKTENQSDCHNSCGGGARFDWLLWGGATIIATFYLLEALFPDVAGLAWPVESFAASTFELVNMMWPGVALGILSISLLARIPREFFIAMLGRGGSFGGILRATFGGVLLDMCSHGILMVGAKLYERGASNGQVMAFLIASPWNSLSLTFILFALVGVGWTLAVIALSMLIAIVSGLIFDALTRRGTLPENPNSVDLPDDFRIVAEARKQLSGTRFTWRMAGSMLWEGLKESRMVLRWIFFGVVLAGLIRTFVPPEMFTEFFGPTLMGLALTLVAATIIEVCSEGTVPVAGDLLTRAGAPGNGFTFLMAGVATDYTEIMILREATKTWRIPLFLPLVTLPQILIVGWIMNMSSGG